jgi:hypothetical protein
LGVLLCPGRSRMVLPAAGVAQIKFFFFFGVILAGALGVFDVKKKPPRGSTLSYKRNSLAIVVHGIKTTVRIGAALVCCILVPTRRFRVVLSNSLNISVHNTRVILCIDTPLICCFQIPSHRLLVVLSNPFAFRVDVPKIVLRPSMPLFCDAAVVSMALALSKSFLRTLAVFAMALSHSPPFEQ